MLVCFITPPSPFLLDERVFPSLGILKVAAVAEQLGYQVDHLDLNGVSNYLEATHTYAQQSEGQVFALTATTPQLPAAMGIAYILHRTQPNCRVIIGGPHPTLTLAALKHSSRAKQAMKQLQQAFDVIVAGDGEVAIQSAISGESPAIINADDPKGDLFLSIEQMNASPLPARHLIDLDSYHYQIEDVRVTPIISQLGCPFGCNFCAGRDSAMLRRTRIRSTSAVIAELQAIYAAYGIQGFMFFDDELNVNPKLPELLAAMIDLQDKLGVEFRCRGFIKAELFTPEQAALMYEAGFRRIMCGFESGSDRILKNINKNATKDDNTRAMEISHRYGLEMKALMSLGHPGESPETVQDTIDWLLAVRPADFDCTIITAYPGSPYYDRAVPVTAPEPPYQVWAFQTNTDYLYMQDIDYAKTADFYKGGMDSYRSYVWSDFLSRDELVQARDTVERTVRDELGIPYYHAQPATQFEASMGQLSGTLLRSGG